MNASSRKREEPTGYLILPIWSPPSHHARIVPIAHPLETFPMQPMCPPCRPEPNSIDPRRCWHGTLNTRPPGRAAWLWIGHRTTLFCRTVPHFPRAPALMAEFQKKKRLDTQKNFCQFIIKGKGLRFSNLVGGGGTFRFHPPFFLKSAAFALSQRFRAKNGNKRTRSS